MTENEAIDVILKDHSNFKNPMSKAYVMACKALEEIQQYRAIGTVEDFKALKVKNTPKKITYQIDKNGLKHEKCPTCVSFSVFGNYCTECGQKIDWGNE